MARFTRRECIGIRDLIGKVRLRWGRDILAGNRLVPFDVSRLHGRQPREQPAHLRIMGPAKECLFTGSSDLTALGSSL
jgi:hypothetical protein